MSKEFIILDADKASSRDLSGMLLSNGYPVMATYELSGLNLLLHSGAYIGVIIDIDSVPIDNRTIRDLALKNPGLCILCTSKDRFHPELKDAICYHIYACLNKPIDPDELIYWVKSIYQENNIPDT